MKTCSGVLALLLSLGWLTCHEIRLNRLATTIACRYKDCSCRTGCPGTGCPGTVYPYGKCCRS